MYNNAEYVEECIESVRAQTYENWEYIIVNNCSTDGSGDIARSYAALDPRIRVLDNNRFLNPAEINHNHALRQISPASKYCKVVFSDDWLFPRCLEEMVAVAEAHPSIGIVSAYGLQGTQPIVKWAGLPYPSHFVGGREMGRLYFLQGVYVFGTPHSLLYRSDLVRARDPFFDESNTNSDRETCIALLRKCDFGFVHQVLTYSRERSGSLTDVDGRVNTSVGGRLYELVNHGAHFLTPAEYENCRSKIVHEYYNYLAICVMLGRRNKEFWSYHKEALARAGLKFDRGRLSVALVARVFSAVLHPRETFQKLSELGSRKIYDRE
jgi:glycosyltransferase involved in cell wall biosynthesis